MQKKPTKITVPTFAVLLTCCALLTRGTVLFAQETPPAPDLFMQSVQQAYDENIKRHENNPDVLVLPGLLADRGAQTVTIQARFTGVGANEAIEFFVVGPDSGKDYETLLLSAAKPSDVSRALKFIGLKPGKSVDYRENRVWPKGERVDLSFTWDTPGKDGGEVQSRTLRAEDMLIDTRTGKTLPVEGFMFVDSKTVDAREPGQEQVYVADVSESRSIASNFNDSTTLLDVPWQAVQGAVYGFQTLDESVKFTHNQPATITLKPIMMKDGSPRVVDLKLVVDVPVGVDVDRAAGASLLQSEQVKFVLSRADGTVVSGRSAAEALGAIGAMVEAGHDPFLTITPGDDLSLSDVRKLYALFDAAQGVKGLRIEPSPTGHLFWRAFFPQEEWRDASVRLGEPWELHVRSDATTGKVVSLLRKFTYDDDQKLSTRDFPVTGPAELAKLLKEETGRWTDGVFVFAPADLSYGQLMSLIRPGMEHINWWYVFPATPASTQPVK